MSYNGYTNYASWAVSFFIDNDKQTHEYWIDEAATIWAAAEDDDRNFTKTEIATRDLAAALQEEFSSNVPEIELPAFRDIFNQAFSTINWTEIAADLIGVVGDDDDSDTGDE